jgi:hypothetical protein
VKMRHVPGCKGYLQQQQQQHCYVLLGYHISCITSMLMVYSVLTPICKQHSYQRCTGVIELTAPCCSLPATAECAACCADITSASAG